MGRTTLDEHFERVFADNYPRLVAIAVAIVGDRGVAEEIAQEAFARCFERRDRLSGYDDPEAWLRLVTVRLALRSRRRRWREVVSPSRRDVAAPSLPTGLGGDVVRAMEHLSPTERRVVAMRYFADLGIDEIATELDVAESTVRVHLHRGRNKIRAALDPAGASGIPSDASTPGG